MFGLDSTLTILLIFCLFAAFAFEFINGFHDTANAVATVIYTNSLKPWVAVIWSGLCNGVGVFLGGITVAMGISNMLPVEVLTDTNIHHNVALVMALLLTAIIWNLATWYKGIPCSSSHTLIGSIFGVGLAYSFIAENKTISYVNWGKAQDIGLALLFSPIIGFSIAILFMYILRQFARKNKSIFKEPASNNPPPGWIRAILLLTCTGVSLSHGSNDGQKGVGLVMLILIAIVPSYFALDHSVDLNDYRKSIVAVQETLHKVNQTTLVKADSFEYAKVNALVADLKLKTDSITDLSIVPDAKQYAIRKNVLVIAKSAKKLLESESISLSVHEKKSLKKNVDELKTMTDFAPIWVIMLISIALGFGTMIGWKRIVKTIGEKIGKQHLTYAQGASSELVASLTITLSTYFGLPVSTTHVLSSGVAGSMVASKGVKNLQSGTIKNIALAWVLTLPFCVVVSGLLFLLFRAIF
ncbi:MAG: inorganic phosphate transporter [Bacteroidota bacterium]